VVTTVQAQDVGDVWQGQRLALDICASCHAVRTSQTLSPDAAAPSFGAIAHTPGMTEAALTVSLTAHPHPTTEPSRLVSVAKCMVFGPESNFQRKIGWNLRPEPP